MCTSIDQVILSLPFSKSDVNKDLKKISFLNLCKETTFLSNVSYDDDNDDIKNFVLHN